MNGETDLQTLIASMRPFLHETAYVFCSIDPAVYAQLPFTPTGLFCEREGVTVIVTERQARENGLPFDTLWACITLEVHSSLTAVGFLALITNRLARAGISVNPVSAFYHDHLFVPWEQKDRARAELTALSRSGAA
jgi:uncharacterized protein